MTLPACTCLHVEGGSDPAHGHGYYQCPECGGLCCSERWTGHAVAGLRWMELMMQQHRHGRVVVQGLAFVQDRMLRGLKEIAAVVPREHQHRAVVEMIRRELGNLSHIWHQSTLGDYLYDVSEARMGEAARPRLYEESADVLGKKLAAISGGASPEAFVAEFEHRDHIGPAEALRRALAPTRPAPATTALPEAQERPTLDPVTAPEEIPAIRIGARRYYADARTGRAVVEDGKLIEGREG